MQTKNTPAVYGRIYVITNLVNGKYYIGQTTDLLKSRWSQHLSDAKCRDGHQFLHKSFRKYGIESFVMEQVATAGSMADLNRLEQAWILCTKSYDPKIGYNRTYGGDAGLTTEARQKIRETLTGRKLSPEHRAKVTAALLSIKRVPLSAEACAKIAATLTGHKRTAESIAKQSASAKGKPGKPKSEEHKAKLSAAQRGRKIPREVVEKVRAANLGRKASAEARANMSRAQRTLNKKYGPETRARISASHTGLKMPAAVGMATRLRQLGKKLSPEHVSAIVEGKRKGRERRAQAIPQKRFEWDC